MGSITPKYDSDGEWEIVDGGQDDGKEDMEEGIDCGGEEDALLCNPPWYSEL